MRTDVAGRFLLRPRPGRAPGPFGVGRGGVPLRRGQRPVAAQLVDVTGTFLALRWSGTGRTLAPLVLPRHHMPRGGRRRAPVRSAGTFLLWRRRTLRAFGVRGRVSAPIAPCFMDVARTFLPLRLRRSGAWSRALGPPVLPRCRLTGCGRWCGVPTRFAGVTGPFLALRLGRVVAWGRALGMLGLLRCRLL
ncbi:hypothetical protein [Actinomadura sp. NPDC000600]|uniref:hypothetical protein n=1 Tax=Actinomadura sp. NPDC000600 TaxID=3154262 RepID=UPI0033960AB8